MNPLSKLILIIIPLGTAIFWDQIKRNWPGGTPPKNIEDEFTAGAIKPEKKRKKKAVAKKEINEEDLLKVAAVTEKAVPRVLREAKKAATPKKDARGKFVSTKV